MVNTFASDGITATWKTRGPPTRSTRRPSRASSETTQNRPPPARPRPPHNDWPGFYSRAYPSISDGHHKQPMVRAPALSEAVGGGHGRAVGGGGARSLVTVAGRNAPPRKYGARPKRAGARCRRAGGGSRRRSGRRRHRRRHRDCSRGDCYLPTRSDTQRPPPREPLPELPAELQVSAAGPDGGQRLAGTPLGESLWRGQRDPAPQLCRRQRRPLLILTNDLGIPGLGVTPLTLFKVCEV